MEIVLAQPAPPSSFVERLIESVPAIADFRSTIRLAVNGVYAESDTLIEPGDEVAVITPVSGG